MKYHINQVITELDQIIHDQLDYLDEKVVPLSDEALEWRPGKYRWNLYEVVEHLNRFGDHYLPQFDAIVDAPGSLRKAEFYRSGPFAEYAVKIIRPVNGVVPNKTKSPRRTNPFLRQLDRSVFDEHRRQQHRLLNILKGADQVNFGRNRVSTVGLNWLRFSFGDSLRIMVYHAERHYIQIDNLVHRRPD